MFDYNNFEHVFPTAAVFPYGRKSIQETETFRKSFNGALFIDRVLSALGLSKAKTYPPKQESALASLHQVLCEADISIHHRLSIFYYLLLDFDGQDARTQYSTKFAEVSGVPKNYQILMRGLWLLDHQQFERALEHVTHPSLIPDFADEILITFAKNCPPGDYSLPLAYYHTVQPILKSQEAIQLLFNAMAQTSVTEALTYTRAQPEAAREQLFKQLISSVLEAAPSEETADRATELVGLALADAEEQWFEEFLSQGEGRRLKHSKDTLLMRKLATGRYSEVVREKGVGSNWATILEGMKSGLGGRTA
ncbi:nuclear pore complex assembly-domain-containing protein [Plectosphaerella plurivora]|uniref:Nuclear pore complex assembly-domain-containing protein n=1 Tax=Plectosphaerella plurivora TaxID=936078 RepID=A0A9P8V294_9PEZI|nr:nuclear pore complex assembly-domain-containing protein [Plectosphaerella plurivora]